MRPFSLAGVFLLAAVAAVPAVALSAATPQVHLHVAVRHSATVPRAIENDALDEAARLWAPYNVVVEHAENQTPLCSTGEASVSVVFDVTHGVHEGDDALGAIRFGAGGPDSTIVMYYAAVTRTAMTGETLGATSESWPAALRDQVIGRTLGRALAHEIGHFLLRWPHHAPNGMMRAAQGATALADPNPDGFGLTSIDVARLRIAAPAPAPLSEALTPCEVPTLVADGR